MFLSYMHNFRGLTIILIVAIHCIYMDFLVWNPESLTPQLIHSFLKLGSTLFVFIAGFLFQHLSHKYTFKRYIRSKLKFVILPYILVSIPAIIKVLYFPDADDKPIFQDYPEWVQIFLYYATGRHLVPLWFMPTIILFYFCAPLLHELDKKVQFYRLLPLFFLISILVPREIFPIHNPLQSFVHFFSAYVFGMFVSHYRTEVFEYVKRYWRVLLGIMLVLFALEIHFTHGLRLNEVIQPLGHFRWLSFALLMMYFFQCHEQLMGNKIGWLAEMSFGIFFVHSYVLAVINAGTRYLQFSVEGNIFTYLLGLAIVIGLCSIGLWITKLIFGGYSRMLVGY